MVVLRMVGALFAVAVLASRDSPTDPEAPPGIMVEGIEVFLPPAENDAAEAADATVPSALSVDSAFARANPDVRVLLATELTSGVVEGTAPTPALLNIKN